MRPMTPNERPGEQASAASIPLTADGWRSRGPALEPTVYCPPAIALECVQRGEALQPL
jgi:hypothetical protein